MSPTIAIDRRRISGLAGGAGGATGVLDDNAGNDDPDGRASAAGDGASADGTAGVAQPVSIRPAAIRPMTVPLLITEANPQYVNVGLPQATAQNVQFLEILNRSDPHPMVGSLVNCNALNGGFNAL